MSRMHASEIRYEHRCLCLPLLVIFTITVLLVVLVLTQQHSRDLNKSKDVTNAGLMPAANSAVAPTCLVFGYTTVLSFSAQLMRI